MTMAGAVKTAADATGKVRDAMDLRYLVIILLFALIATILWMIGHDQALRDDAAFMSIAGNLCGNGGIGIALVWLFGGTKSGGEAMNTLATNAGPQPPEEPKP